MKRTFVMLMLAACGALTALPAAGQVNPEAAPGPTPSGPAQKYEVFAGFAYSRFRQATVSYSGLMGGKVTLARDWGKYFQLMGAVDYYRIGTGHPGLQSYGDPSVYSVLVGPAIHATLYENLSGSFFGELGGEHTGGMDMTPSISFAGGFGGSLIYNLGHNFAAQLTGDRVGASFSLPNNTPQLANSTHRTWNARGAVGLVYHF